MRESYYSLATALLFLYLSNVQVSLGASNRGDNFSLSISNDQNPTPSALSEGEWFQFAVLSSGVYKITQQDLEDAGVGVRNLDPRNISIHGYGGGMLPQLNSTPVPTDLPELAIQVVGESDGSFDPEDYILFYATGPDREVFHDAQKSFTTENNLYSDSAFYYLSFHHPNGKRLASVSNQGSNHPKVTTFDAFLHHEQELYNLLSSGKKWFGERFFPGDVYSIPFNFFDIQPNSPVKIFLTAMSASTSTSSFNVRVNGQSIGEIALDPIPKVNFTTGENLYKEKGKENQKWFQVNPGALTDNLSIGMTFQANAGEGFGYLNALSVHVKRQLKFRGEQLIFQSIESLNQPQTTFQMENLAGSEASVWDITDPINPGIQTYSIDGTKIVFGSSTDLLRKFVVFNRQNISSPIFTKIVPNQNLAGKIETEMLIVSYSEFLREAERLAAFRETFDNLKVTVVSPEQIYHEYSSGRQDVSAVRNYVKYLYNHGNLKYLLLFGKCSYTYKDELIIADNTNFVPTYQSDNSLHPVETYSSDDYFGFLEPHEGNWREGLNAEEHDLEIGIGRLPVKSLADAKIIIDKIIHYSTHKDAFGAWRNDIVFVADDEDGNTHQEDADKLATLVDSTHEDYNIRKIYLGAYPQEGNSSEAAQNALNDAIKKGALIVNYSGHGNEKLWAEEKMLTIPMINQWQNYEKLSFFVTATCDFGKYDDPTQVSGGEHLMFSAKGGAIGMVTTSRPVYSNTNFLLNNALYNVIFNKEDYQSLRLGDIIKTTKNNSISGYRNRNFSLLGDPSMRLAYPKQKILISKISNTGSTATQDTLKALGKINIRGFIANEDSSKLTSFNGKANVTIYDKPANTSTLSSNGTVMDYKVQNRVLFRGKVSVRDGEFLITFVVPKNINYEFGRGKMSLYGYDEELLLDAHIGYTDLVIGGSAPQEIVDDAPPKMEMFMDDETFVSGDVTGSNTRLLVKLSDESGININNNGLGQDIVATLNSDQVLILNEFYETELDSYKEGRIDYPFNELAEGTYTLSLEAWDINSNRSERSLKFIVASDAKLALHNVLNFPNPLYDQTSFQFNHNRAGDDLQINVLIYTLKGDLVKEISALVPNSTSRIAGFDWEGTDANGNPLSNGTYIYKVVVQSLQDMAKSQQYKRLVIIN